MTAQSKAISTKVQCVLYVFRRITSYFKLRNIRRTYIVTYIQKTGLHVDIENFILANNHQRFFVPSCKFWCSVPDDGNSFGNVLFYGHELSLSIFDLLTFCVVDIIFKSVVLDCIIVWLFGKVCFLKISVFILEKLVLFHCAVMYSKSTTTLDVTNHSPLTFGIICRVLKLVYSLPDSWHASRQLR